ncbi:3-hydroxyisobutyrate dehydrogenase [Microbacterium esteraromaticum]|uniref:3-hydroxyisobutyrate dehydrogenase n=1 Tax=Microbacterium esteraromaticum TaxID=57043 RepID=A0A939IR76_9MICO|nr:3-hydroxyisobutyrate dehydrogenase [Microbacterium esteraromaticum]MBN8205445.1 3-hydroxyisobutyrate dehydrogenase [Microbacterium esteraromaticum]MBN8415599.1 3-hydroxyisobutyrate dehydrogenase [Microbacterium esteraromaticum]
MSDIAFLGLGHMGGPMAANLVAAGHRVLGFDPVSAARDAARAKGIEVAADPNAAVAGAEIVITMLPTGAHVIAAYQGDEHTPGLLASASPGTLFLDCSTIAVDEARRAHDLALTAGHRAADAPVSGGVIGAQRGTLAFMVGGSDEDFAAALPVLQIMGERIVHCGGSGLGQAAKVCNNMILGITQIAVAEAFVLGERLGLGHQALFDVASNASGQCWALTTNCPVPGPVTTSPANDDYRPGFAGALMSKDLGLAEAAIALTGVDAQLGIHARDMFRAYAEGDGAHRDFSGIIEMIRAQSSSIDG